MAKEKKGPVFIKFFKPLQQALISLGGSATPREAKDRVITQLNISESELDDTTPSGVPRVENRIDWARQYLIWSGYMDGSIRGVWALTEKGFKDLITDGEEHKIFEIARKVSKGSGPDPVADPSEAPVDEYKPDSQSQLIEVLHSLPASGFERLCQFLLRKSGFAQVEVTGRSGDGGIDGIGILEVNPLVSFKVLFQCKKWASKPVSPSDVRDFRGAMMGRADKGIIITTGRFTQDARKESIRDGAPPIELVDGEKLVELCQRHEIGLKPRIVYDIDSKFFDEFR